MASPFSNFVAQIPQEGRDEGMEMVQQRQRFKKNVLFKFCIELKVVFDGNFAALRNLPLWHMFTEKEKCPQIIINVSNALLPGFIYKYLFLVQTCMDLWSVHCLLYKLRSILCSLRDSKTVISIYCFTSWAFRQI